MLDTVLKIVSEQVLSSRSALERPITQLKYGLAAAIVGGAGVVGALAAASGGFYLWLTRSGLDQPSALIVVSLFLILSSALMWKSFGYLTNKEIAGQERAAQEQNSTVHPDAHELIMHCVVEVAQAFIEGTKKTQQPLRRDCDSYEAQDANEEPRL